MGNSQITVNNEQDIYKLNLDELKRFKDGIPTLRRNGANIPARWELLVNSQIDELTIKKDFSEKFGPFFTFLAVPTQMRKWRNSSWYEPETPNIIHPPRSNFIPSLNALAVGQTPMPPAPRTAGENGGNVTILDWYAGNVSENYIRQNVFGYAAVSDFIGPPDIPRIRNIEYASNSPIANTLQAATSGVVIGTEATVSNAANLAADVAGEVTGVLFRSLPWYVFAIAGGIIYLKLKK